MSQKHKFHFIPATNKNHVTYQNFYNLNPKAAIHDDILRYMSDTLEWFSSIHLSGKHFKHGRGLSLYGATLINQEGILIFNRIIYSWIDLFSQAPTIFMLNGGLTVNADKTVGDLYKFEVNRDDLLKQLNILLETGKTVIKNKESSILHLGI